MLYFHYSRSATRTIKNPPLRYYEVDENKIKQIRDDIEDLPKELLESIKQGIEKIKETDEYRALVTIARDG